MIPSVYPNPKGSIDNQIDYRISKTKKQQQYQKELNYLKTI
jgi:hypothetical protein